MRVRRSRRSACTFWAPYRGARGRASPTINTNIGDTGGEAARDLTHELRGAGLSADRRFGGGSMKSQMKSADRSGAAVALIVGADELEAGEVTLRPLRNHDAAGGEQRRVRRDALVAELRALRATN